MEVTNLPETATLSTLEEHPVVVVCAADNNYSMPLAVAIRSAMENFRSNRKLLWFVIDGGITSRNKRRILKSLNSEMFNSGQCEVRWLPKPQVFDDKVVLSDQLPSSQSLPNAAFYRLVIPDLLPEQFTKAIYLDCDVAVNASLEKLWDINLGENYILATRNAYRHTISHPTSGLLNWKELGFSPDSKKFASGVIVLNLEKWRFDNMSAKALNYLANNQKYIRWHDSDVLHAIIKDKWKEIDFRWNFYKERFILSPEEAKDAFILHFMSKSKPWVAIEKTAESDLFFHYLRLTDWSSYKHTVPQRLWRRLKREFRNFESKIFK